ncbi:hypothetical protein DSO57_1014249 [Entomophthora muscae]|uniref:Uncharacterized protein n=1 Tax=Entomophthora muscae TaxID=34485 RepID=A0ACC2UED9_9FUNG|nr:hypothetical protein DSO57_1014249 [Entomophthora muscae]
MPSSARLEGPLKQGPKGTQLSQQGIIAFLGFKPWTPVGHQAVNPAACLRLSGLKPEVDLTLEKPTRPTSGVLFTLEPFLLGNSLILANETNNPNDVLTTSWATTNEKTPVLPQDQGPQRDDKIIVSKGELKIYFPNPAN